MNFAVAMVYNMSGFIRMGPKYAPTKIANKYINERL